ncbi:MAG: methylenetetrahydrofolate reductase [Proteobacteria bacterium]|nr:methylenetetrahydrofolate reductase [Pseudomonadota bacterium]
MQLIELARKQPRPAQAHATKRIDSSSSEDRLRISLEFLPPDSLRREDQVWTSIERLAPLQPDSIAITHRPTKSTRDRTRVLIERIVQSFDVKVAAHLTAIGMSRAEIVDLAQVYWNAGVRALVALRGDALHESLYRSAADGFACTADMIGVLKCVAPFEIAVSAYPEKHPESPSFDHDLDLLKAKIDAGATTCITQYFYNNDVFFRFQDRLQCAGISIPVVPGILPLYNLSAISRSAARANVTIPATLLARAAGLDNDFESRRIVATVLAAEQIDGLFRQGVPRVHLFTLNRADLIYAICHMLGLRQAPTRQ